MAAEEFDIQRKYEKRKEEERQREKGIVEDKKRVVQVIKLFAPAGGAKSGPPLGPVLGQHQINTNDFCKEFNRLTADMDPSLVVPAFLFKKADRTFDIKLRDVTTMHYVAAARKFRRVKKDQNYYNISMTATRSLAIKKFSDTLRNGSALALDFPFFKALKTVLGTYASAKIRFRVLRRRRRKKNVTETKS